MKTSISQTSDIEFKIAQHTIGVDHPTFIVAEMSGNHHQSLEQAISIVKAAKEAGADAIKLQTYTPDTITIKSDLPCFKINSKTPWDGQTLYELYQKAFTPWEWHHQLQSVAKDIGITLFSAPFDLTAVDFLEKMKVPAYKIASFELVDIPLIEAVAKTHKPIILSTGMSNIDEISEAVNAARQAGARDIALLKCTSAYPAMPESMHLKDIETLASTFDVPIGLSDHTLGIAVPIAAVTLGACMIEKHFTLSRQAEGPDAAFSLEPHEFKAMSDAVRVAEKALKGGGCAPSEAEKGSVIFRKSLFVTEDVQAGSCFEMKNVRPIRPGIGLHTRHYKEILGKKAKCFVARGTPLAWEHISD